VFFLQMLPVTTIEMGRPPRNVVISESIIDEIISEFRRFTLAKSAPPNFRGIPGIPMAA
jgi:hypothetical protein